MIVFYLKVSKASKAFKISKAFKASKNKAHNISPKIFIFYIEQSSCNRGIEFSTTTTAKE